MERPRAYDGTCPLCRFMGGPCIFHGQINVGTCAEIGGSAGHAHPEPDLAETKPITETPQ